MVLRAPLATLVSWRSFVIRSWGATRRSAGPPPFFVGPSPCTSSCSLWGGPRSSAPTRGWLLGWCLPCGQLQASQRRACPTHCSGPPGWVAGEPGQVWAGRLRRRGCRRRPSAFSCKHALQPEWWLRIAGSTYRRCHLLWRLHPHSEGQQDVSPLGSFGQFGRCTNQFAAPSPMCLILPPGLCNPCHSLHWACPGTYSFWFGRLGLLGNCLHWTTHCRSLASSYPLHQPWRAWVACCCHSCCRWVRRIRVCHHKPLSGDRPSVSKWICCRHPAREFAAPGRWPLPCPRAAFLTTTSFVQGAGPCGGHAVGCSCSWQGSLPGPFPTSSATRRGGLASCCSQPSPGSACGDTAISDHGAPPLALARCWFRPRLPAVRWHRWQIWGPCPGVPLWRRPSQTAQPPPEPSGCSRQNRGPPARSWKGKPAATAAWASGRRRGWFSPCCPPACEPATAGRCLGT